MRSRSQRVASVLRLLALPAGLALVAAPLIASDTPEPSSVTVAGSLQEELGCPGDWQPDCAATHLAFDAEDAVWQALFDVPPGTWEYKAPLNDSWSENYGLGAQRDGSNIPLSLADPTAVKFYYDHETHWITDGVNSVIATAPGSFQDELGCPGDWQPDCLRSWLQDPDDDGIFTFEAKLPAGGYETKVAHGEGWDENYGQGGVPNGSNIPFTVASDCAATRFEYALSSHLLSVGPAPPAPQPSSVTIAGSLQEELGCPGDWQPDCAATHLAFDADDQVWQGTFSVPAGDWEYKAPLNDSWDENYGANATRDGPNIPLGLGADTDVKFYYSHETHWVTDDQSAVIATLAGSFQSELGCPGDWQPWCLRSWLQDPDGDGVYTFRTDGLPSGDYEVKIAHDEDWAENYGQGGVPGGANIPFSVPSPCADIFFTYDPITHLLTVGTGPGAPAGNLGLAQAHWVAENTIAWDSPAVGAGAVFELHSAERGGLTLTTDGVSGADVSIALALDPAGLPSSVTDRFPHLAGYAALTLDPGDLAAVPQLLKGQIAVSVTASDGTPLDATSIQIPGVLDDLFLYEGPLGVDLSGGDPVLRLWAPTAQSVTLHLFDDPDPATTSSTLPMTEDEASGVWSVGGDAGWLGRYYLYEIEVFAPTTGRVEHNIVTDPYSLSLSANSARSQIVDLDDPTLAPDGWATLGKPPLGTPEDSVIYELHVRDFSARDPDVPEELRGTFLAFSLADSHGMRHLGALAEAGLTHVHLLPSFDFATVNERRSEREEADPAVLATYPPDSEQQQAAVSALKDQDGYNWGYDPWHYTVPEGSYATDPDGSARVREFREMVQALNRTGLRVVMDVVYNHTSSAGQNARSVLDRIVPGYYHRLNAVGEVETSSCCPNTASEHSMMEKLMIDSILTWARQYRVDGFRFDLMGHHMLSNMVAVRAALDSLTMATDGVDGPRISLYGEGWNFGEVADGARGTNATQANVAGTGIGTFNDRIRDGARGGGPFSGLQEQGFITGLFYDPNATGPADPDRLLRLADWIRVSLAGNLRDYPLVDRLGNAVLGSQVNYNGQPAGYTLDPQESINYVAAHDNETLFDAVQLKVPVGTAMADRVRVQNLGLSLVALGQGIPFVHAGMDMLRSKSLDRDSFDSGDWFNAIDFTYETNNWGIGLPVASKNQSDWPIMRPLLGDPALGPARTDILRSVAHFQEMLRIRRSSPLFRLSNAADVIARVGFLNTGPAQLPGLIVMTLEDPDGRHDRQRARIVVLFNANDEPQSFTAPSLEGTALALHEVQQSSSDLVVRSSTFDRASGTFSVPARTTAVFVAPRSAADQIRLLIRDVEALVEDGSLRRWHGLVLIARLRIALRKIEHGYTSAASHTLEAFVRHVEALVRVGILPCEQGAPLITAAEDVIAMLEEDRPCRRGLGKKRRRPVCCGRR